MKTLIALSVALLIGAPALAQNEGAQTQTTAPAGKAGKQSSSTVQQNLGLGNHDMSQPIHVSSNNFEGDTATKVGFYVGNVIVTQGNLKMHADRVRLDLVKGSLAFVTSTGNVVVDAPNGTGMGDKGVYDLTKHTVTLTGKKVTLTKQKNVMNGTKLVMDLNTNLAHLTADGAPGSRVTALFIPPPQKNAAANGGTAAAKDGKTPGKSKPASTNSNPAPQNDK